MQDFNDDSPVPAKDVRLYTLHDLKQKPAWSLIDLSVMLGLPLSSLTQVMAEHPLPSFKLGRRVYVLQADAMDWLEEMSIKTSQHQTVTKRRRNSRRAA